VSDGAFLPPFQKYCHGIYWSAMTLTGIGYGDIIPQNATEQIVCTALMLLVRVVALCFF
jgi:voltage-gated potassium channel Kch